MNINDYVNLNLDKNDMSTPLNNIPGNYYQDVNPSGTQMMDNLIQQIEQMPQSQPLMLSGQQSMQTPNTQYQQFVPNQQIQQFVPNQQTQQFVPNQQTQQFVPNQQTQQFVPNQQTQSFIPTQKPISEKEKALKELELSSSEEKVSEKKQTVGLTNSFRLLTSNIKETVIAVLIYVIISNPFITPLVLKYIPFFETSPNLLFGLKVVLFALIYHLVRLLV